MARIRSIHPNTPTDPDLALQPVEGRLMFIYSLTISDDAGNLEGNPLGLRMALFPADEWATVERMTMLTEGLIVGRFYVPYEADGKQYLHIRNFPKYQKLDHPTAPKFPLFPGQEYTYHARKKGNKFEVRTAKGPPLLLTAHVPHTNDPLTLGVLQRRTGLDRTGLDRKRTTPPPASAKSDADACSTPSRGNGQGEGAGKGTFLETVREGIGAKRQAPPT